MYATLLQLRDMELEPQGLLIRIDLLFLWVLTILLLNCRVVAISANLALFYLAMVFFYRTFLRGYCSSLRILRGSQQFVLTIFLSNMLEIEFRLFGNVMM
jgi:hypothetical protein